MKAIYENDTARGTGYGIFRLEQVAVPDKDSRYALIRSGDMKSLHPGGWEDTECSLTPDSLLVEGDTLRLYVGPDVVNRLDQLNTYRLLYLPGTGAPEKAVLELGHIVYAPVNGVNVVGAPKTKAEPAPAPKADPPPERLPEIPAPTARTGLPGWKIALAALIVAALCLGAGVLVKGKLFPAEDSAATRPVADVPADPSARTAIPEEPGNEAPAMQAKSDPEVAASPLSPLDQARQFLRGGGNAEAALALARSLPETQEGRDAAFLLVEAAADQGNVEAMMDLAEFYDPQSRKPRGSIIADAEQAWIWYSTAAKAGKADAAARSQAVRAWLEAEAGKGNAEAKAVLGRLQ